MSIVSNLIDRTEVLSETVEGGMLKLKEDIISGNRVTGYSLNFPIWKTCQPTKVCIETCYYAKGMTAFSASLRKQIRLYRFVKTHPEHAALMIAKMYRAEMMDYICWNGGGDLFAESVQAINLLAIKLPNMVQWVRTRILNLAALIIESPNVHIHISLDRVSMKKLDQYERMEKASQNYFFTYQYDRDEKTNPRKIDQRISLLYFDGDQQPAWLKQEDDARACPRTFMSDRDDACRICRKCFNGEHQRHRLGASGIARASKGK